MIKKRLKIEAIPNPVVKLYALIARKSPCIRDIHQEVAEEVCSKISSGRILDVGTGPGYVPFEIAQRAPGLEIVGIDLSSGMVDIANKKAKELGLDNRVRFKLANASSLPFPDEYFDFVISTLSLHHWSDPSAGFKEIFRVLKNNGQACIYDLRKDTPKEVNMQARTKYGWFLAFLFLNVVRLHSSMSLKHAQELLSALDVNFSQKSVQGNGVILVLQFLK